MSGACGSVPEIRTATKSRFLRGVQVTPPVAPDPYLTPLSRRSCAALLGLLAAAVVVVFVVQFFRGFVGEYHDAVTARIAAETRAKVAEDQLAQILRHGDKGILVANIGPDLAGYQLRLVPQQFNGRK